MIKITDDKTIHQFVEKHKINELFTQDMTQYMECFQYRKNEYIVRHGEDINYLFIFVQGRVKVYSSLSNGKSLLLAFQEKFSVLGDLEVINGKVATTNVQAVKDSYCVAIPFKDLRKVALDDPKFLRFICNNLGEKLERASNNSSINLLYPLENRLASYISVTNENIENGLIIDFNGNLVEISELLGASYRHLLRTLNSFCDKGILEKDSNNYKVLDIKELDNLTTDLYKE